MTWLSGHCFHLSGNLFCQTPAHRAGDRGERGMSVGTDDQAVPVAAPGTLPFSDAILLPPEPGLCQQCAIDHLPEAPHNPDSLFYKYWFRLQEARAGREERWPTWTDAMAHCTAEVKVAWIGALAERGVQV